MKHHRHAATLGILLAVGSAASYAQGQETEGGSLLQEVVVTAQRREEKLQDVPVAVSAFSNAQLEQLGVTETLGLIKLIPNLLGFNNTGLGTANGYYIRGIGNTESIATFDPPVGTYVDDVFISRQNANNLGLFDVDRIEVLRGPQGTLFGRNTTGGAMNVILKKPAEEFGGYVEAGFGQFAARQIRASIDIPFSDTVRSKLSAFYVEDDGYVSNPVTGEDDLNAGKSLGVRGALHFLFSDAVNWHVALQYTNDEGANLLNFASGSGGRAYQFGSTANPLVAIPARGPQVELEPQRAGLPPTSTTAQFIEARCAGSITRSRFYCTGLRQTGTPLANLITGNKRNYNLGNEVENLMITSNLQWETGFGQLEFITGYVDLQQEFALDFFNGTAVNTAMGSQASNPAGGFTIANEGEHKQISQEIKLTGDLNDNIRYVAGLYYFDEDNDTDFADLFSISPTTTLVLEDRRLKNTAKAWAAYTQWDFTLGQDWTLTLGGRYTDETKEVDFISNVNPNVGVAAASRANSANMLALGIPLEQSTKLFTPRLALKYDVNDDVNLFASATRGFKSGGWNARGTSAVANQPFAPEKVWSYEAGLRSDWMDGRLRFNLTAFLLDVEDLQTPSAFVNPATQAITFITRNFSGMKNRGLEAELIFSPVRDLTLFAMVGVQNAEYKDIDPSILAQAANCVAAIAMGTSTANLCGSGIVNPSGAIAEPVRIPDTLTLGGSYTFHLGDNWKLTPNVVWAQAGDNNVGTNGAPAGVVDAYDSIDAGITLANSDGSLQVQATCRNCSNELQIVSSLSDLVYVQDPRTWMLNVKYRFGGP